MIRQHGFHGNTTKTSSVFLFFALLSPPFFLSLFQKLYNGGLLPLTGKVEQRRYCSSCSVVNSCYGK